MDLYDGTTFLQTVPANIARGDIQPGSHGFTLATPARLLDGTTHVLHVRYGGTGTELHGSPVTFNPAAASTLNGYIDQADRNALSGWTQDSARASTSLTVDLYDGTTYFLTVPANIARGDIQPGNHGFSVPTPARLTDGRSHVLHVRYGGTATELHGSPLTILIVPSLAVLNFSFEAPALSGTTYQYSPPGASWTFSSAGIATNSGVFTGSNPNAPDGVQVAFIQGVGSVSQAIPGFVANTSYAVTVAAAQRGDTNSSSLGVQVSLDGAVLGTFTPAGSRYADYPLYFTTTSGTHTLAFTGLNPSGSDNSALIDNVRVGPASATATGQADVILSLTTSTTGLCAGGYDRGTQTYTYLVKETGARASRGAGDPHVATLTATVTDAVGRPLAGKTVTLTWTQPGLGQGDDAPPVTFTGTTNAQGQISTLTISGDVAGSAPVTAICGQAKATLTLNYQAAQATWQYQDATGAWQAWDGTLAGLETGADTSIPVPLKIMLNFNNQAVTGHSMNWLINQAFDQSGNLLLPDSNGQYPGHGHFSGPISTTDATGSAFATFSIGFAGGRINMEVDDNNVYVQ